jgi:hypothetical protein
MAPGILALLALSACGQEPSALPPTGTHFSVASGQQLGIVLSAVGGQYNRPPFVRGTAVRFVAVTRTYGPPPGEVPADSFVFAGVEPGRAIVVFNATTPQLLTTIDTVDVQ